MSTSLNDTVAAVYKDFMTKLDLMNERQSFRYKLAKFCHNPLRILSYIKNKLAIRRVYGMRMLGLKTASLSSPVHLNEFTPSERTYPGTKIAVYTVITGGYDDLKKHVYVDDDIDYYVITDSEISQSTDGGGGLYYCPCLNT